MRKADKAWAEQMGRLPKKKKPLVLIGIVCDDEIKDLIDLKSTKDKYKYVKLKKKPNPNNYFCLI